MSFLPTRRESPLETTSSSYHVFPFTLEEEEYAALVAVFWADVDITGEGGGNVWYRTVTQHQDRILLQRISTSAKEYHPEYPRDMSFTWALIVTWDHVGYNKKHTDKVHASGVGVYMHSIPPIIETERVHIVQINLFAFHTAQHIPASFGNRWCAFSGTVQLR